MDVSAIPSMRVGTKLVTRQNIDGGGNLSSRSEGMPGYL
jgi:hypothetical protein